MELESRHVALRGFRVEDMSLSDALNIQSGSSLDDRNSTVTLGENVDVVH